MPKFKFKAKSPAGRSETGVITARTEEEAIGELRRRQLQNISVKLDRGGIGLKPGASTEDLVIFTRQLATMIGAGIPMMESLEILHAQAANPGLVILARAHSDQERTELYARGVGEVKEQGVQGETDVFELVEVDAP